MRNRIVVTLCLCVSFFSSCTPVRAFAQAPQVEFKLSRKALFVAPAQFQLAEGQAFSAPLDIRYGKPAYTCSVDPAKPLPAWVTLANCSLSGIVPSPLPDQIIASTIVVKDAAGATVTLPVTFSIQ